MSNSCNIDPYGKKLRIVAGAFVEGIGLLLFVMWIFEMGPAWLVIPAGVLWASGMVMMTAGLLGRCPLRAMGVKTSC
ncbi:MAG: hypothetical protein DWI11_03270 [Planctomycetota bacterium]|nr:MAG: hypothetical protein DWI11_03270 [Planctomycetota bacterium]